VLPRVLHRWRNVPPPIVPAIAGWEVQLSRLTHGLLYAFLLLQPVLGLLTVWFGGRGIGIPGTTLILPSPLPENHDLHEQLEDIHKWIGTAFYYVIGLHILGALWHHFLRRDSTLRRMNGLPTLIPVQWGQPAKDDKAYFNQRSECWGKMREWLEHGQIPDSDDLADELTSLDYGNDVKFRIQLQSKRDIKKNGGKSPDRADSLALSFVPELIDRKMTNAKVRPVQRRTVIWTRSA
jgi:hypothetical protein